MSYVAAATIGLLLGLLGGGGSALTLPSLVYLMSIEPVMATAYSLFIVGCTSLAGTVSYLRQGLVDGRAVLLFGVPTIVGVIFSRAWLVPALPEIIFRRGSFELGKSEFLMVWFAIIMLAAALSMIFDGRKNLENAARRSLPTFVIVLSGLMVGVATGIVGAGGGFVIVPALVILLRLSMRKAIATSLGIIAIKSILGFAGDYRNFNAMDWPLLIRFTLVAVAGIVVGVRLNRSIAADKLKLAFGWMVLVIGIGILIRELLPLD